jgi:Glycosyl transferase family 11
MIKPSFSGRSGNILLENVGYSILSKKFNLKVDYYMNEEYFEVLGLKLNKNGRILQNMNNYFDTDLINLLKNDSLDNGISYDGNFQMKEFVIEHKNEIINHFNMKFEERNDNEVFIHVRLGDATKVNPGIEYYRNCLNSIDFKTGYISSDSLDNEIIKILIDEYQLIKYIDDPIKTINFAKNFKNLVLSKGTFSWWIGILSKSDNIMYPKEEQEWPNPPHWHGNIFVFDEWKGIKY